MLFEEVPFLSLIPHQKYKIKWEDLEYKGTFYLHNTVTEGIFAVFLNVQLKATILPYLYVKVYPEEQGKILRPIFQAQQAMEQRYLHTILREILGDPCFDWCSASKGGA
jgi:hypothetical protein